MAYRFRSHIIITGQLTCLTGLHIGSPEDSYNVGSLEHPIVRDVMTGYPYIPGSSLKGKLRSLLEWTLGKIEPDGQTHGRSCQDPHCAVCRIFGAAAGQNDREVQAVGPTRLIVRDAFPSEATLEQFVKSGRFLTEIKTETSLDRITAEATSRFIERVPAGAQFDVEFVYGIYDLNDQGLTDVENLRYVYMALDLLEASVLGGGGSRGSGKIALENLAAVIKVVDDYQAQADGRDLVWPRVEGRSASNVVAKIQEKLGLPRPATEESVSCPQ